jgi:hypothetical protein
MVTAEPRQRTVDDHHLAQAICRPKIGLQICSASQGWLASTDSSTAGGAGEARKTIRQETRQFVGQKLAYKFALPARAGFTSSNEKDGTLSRAHGLQF